MKYPSNKRTLNWTPRWPLVLATMAVALGLGMSSSLPVQYSAPSTPVGFAGLANEALRSEWPTMTNWDLGGSARFRYEIKEGFAIPGVLGSADFLGRGAEVNNEYLLGKIRLHAGYSSEWWGFLAEGRSSFADDDERYAYANSPAVAGTVKTRGDGPESDTLDLHQGYLSIGNLQQFPLALKLGRQELSFGEERLVGAFAWNNIGRVFDAAKARFQTDLLTVELFTAFPVIPEDGRFNVDNVNDWFSGFYATSPLIPKHKLDFYFFSRNTSAGAINFEPSPQFPQPGPRDIYTLGLRWASAPHELGNWDYAIEPIGQFGDFEDVRAGAPAGRQNHLAYALILQGGYTLADTWAKPRFGLEYALASGDSNPRDGEHGTFENLFPTNHKFYGYMDFISLQNIHDLRPMLTLKPTPRVSLALEGHGFWLADTHDNFYSVAGVPRGGIAPTGGSGYGINPGNGSFVGTELDVIAGFALSRMAQLELGYGHFFTGDYIQQSLSGLGSRDADYVYLQANISF